MSMMFLAMTTGKKAAGPAPRAVIYDGMTARTLAKSGQAYRLVAAPKKDKAPWRVVAGPDASHCETINEPGPAAGAKSRSGSLVYATRTAPWTVSDGDQALSSRHPTKDGLAVARILKSGTTESAALLARDHGSRIERLEAFSCGLARLARAKAAPGKVTAALFVGTDGAWLVGLENQRLALCQKIGRLSASSLKSGNAQSSDVERALDSFSRSFTDSGRIDALILYHDRADSEQASALLASADLGYVPVRKSVPMDVLGDLPTIAALLGSAMKGPALDFSDAKSKAPAKNGKKTSEMFMAMLVAALVGAGAPILYAGHLDTQVREIRKQTAEETARAPVVDAADADKASHEDAVATAARSRAEGNLAALREREAALMRKEGDLFMLQKTTRRLDPAGPGRLITALGSLESQDSHVSDSKAVWLPDGSGKLEVTGASGTRQQAASSFSRLGSMGFSADVGSGGIYRVGDLWVWQTKSPLSAVVDEPKEAPKTEAKKQEAAAPAAALKTEGSNASGGAFAQITQGGPPPIPVFRAQKVDTRDKTEDLNRIGKELQAEQTKRRERK
jgi:hypothetical protein